MILNDWRAALGRPGAHPCGVLRKLEQRQETIFRNTVSRCHDEIGTAIESHEPPDDITFGVTWEETDHSMSRFAHESVYIYTGVALRER